MVRSIWFLIIMLLLICPATNEGAHREINAHKANRVWQGVATDGEFIYTTTDQDVHFKVKPGIIWDNNNIISVYAIAGNFIKEKKNAYTGMSKLGHFMSFGDIQHIDGHLYATVYDRTPPFESRIVKFNKVTLDVENVYQIGNDLAEGLDKHADFYWVVYHSNNKIKQFDNNFQLVKEYVLSESPLVNAGYQGIFWDGNYILVNLHGANSYGEFYAGGLDRYMFNGATFKFIERIKPPTYGSGQGVEKYGELIYWADRPANKIIISKLTKTRERALTSK